MNNRCVIVLGVASDIGAACARQIAETGANVVVADRDAAATSRLAGEIGGLAVTCDVTDEAQIAAMVASAVDYIGRIDGLVSLTAATGDRHPGSETIVSMDAAAWDHSFSVNLRGPMLAAKHVIPQMARSGGGSIVHISSTAAILSLGSLPAYASSKAGMHALTQSIATAHGNDRIRCNTVAPGFIRTSTTAKMDPRFFDMTQRHNLLPFIGEPDDIAAPVCFLITDAARYITGQLIAVDGGQTCHLPIFDDIKHGGAAPTVHKVEQRA